MTENIAGFVYLEHARRVQLSPQRAILRFPASSVDTKKCIKTVVWTRIDRRFFDEKENAYF